MQNAELHSADYLCRLSKEASFGFGEYKFEPQMNFDRNTVTGFILLVVLFFAFFFYTNRQQAALQKQKAFDKIDYSVSDNGKTDTITGLFFTPSQVTKSGEDQVVTYQLEGKDGSLITHKFTVKPDYMVDFDLSINGANQLLSNNTLLISW